jgi:hypothetical protein
MDAFIWTSAEIRECWMAHSVTKEETCMVHSGCSKSHARHVQRPKQTFAWQSCANLYHGQWPILLLNSCRLRWDQLFDIHNQNCWSVVSFCSRTMQHLITIMMCKIWCSVVDGRCWHIFPVLQFSCRVINGCLHMCKRSSGKTIWIRRGYQHCHHYTISAWTNTGLQLIVYHTDAKSVRTVLVTALRRGSMLSTGISIVLLSCILLLQ